ncbi:MAG: YlxR family protein [Roseburia sp.]|nr:YlxR family protein [Roseburia sp.]MCM1098425.1 YlxR family protein [Ruminococcus flavefaciens]
MAKRIPLRQCVGCGEMKGKRDMMRILRTEDNAICLDTTGKKNGRGAYICRSRECLQKARKNKGLERSFKMSIPSEVYDTLEKEFDSLEAK